MAGWLLGLESAVVTGLFAGALTSAPAYAAAAEFCDDPATLAVTFVVAYPLGLVGTVLMVQFLPRLMGDDLRKGGHTSEEEEERQRKRSPELMRAFDVREQDVVGRSLQQLELLRRHGCLVTEVLRGGVAIEPAADLQLLRGDVALVSGQRDDVRAVAQRLGRFERSTGETDIAVYAGGILLGRFRRIGPFSAHVPMAARRLVRDLGILLFVAETGVRAGGSSLATVRPVLLQVVGVAAVTVVLTVALSMTLARRWLALGPLEARGSTSAGMTFSAALVTLRNASDSNEAAISYAAAYAVGNVLAAFAGQIAVFLG